MSERETPASPYAELPPRNFWRHGVANQHMAEIDDLYRPKFEITKDMAIVTAGSCFAQHIARNFRARGYNVLDGEPTPLGMPADVASKYGFGMYSLRYGNIYTSRELWQMWQEALGRFEPACPVWEKDGAYYDAFRPNIEPDGLASAELVAESRHRHLRRMFKTYRQADVFVFTFGLTETWEHIETGTIYPTAPGTIAGSYDPSRFRFKNLTFNETYNDFLRFRLELKKRKPDVKFLVTVSPVPLTATADEHHVLTASTYSKSVLRAVAGQLAEQHDDIDYFPSYEIVTAPSSRGFFFESNMRNVSSTGVRMVMDLFFAAHGASVSTETATPTGGSKSAPSVGPAAGPPRSTTEDDTVCEDALLEAFA